MMPLFPATTAAPPRRTTPSSRTTPAHAGVRDEIHNSTREIPSSRPAPPGPKLDAPADSHPPGDFSRRWWIAALAMVEDDDGREERQAIQAEEPLSDAELLDHLERIRPPKELDEVVGYGKFPYPEGSRPGRNYIPAYSTG